MDVDGRGVALYSTEGRRKAGEAVNARVVQGREQWHSCRAGMAHLNEDVEEGHEHNDEDVGHRDGKQRPFHPAVDLCSSQAHARKRIRREV